MNNITSCKMKTFACDVWYLYPNYSFYISIKSSLATLPVYLVIAKNLYRV